MRKHLWPGMAQLGSVWQGRASRGSALLGLAWQGLKTAAIVFERGGWSVGSAIINHRPGFCAGLFFGGFVNTVRSFLNLIGMRRHSAGGIKSLKWALRLLWRNNQTSRRRSHVERRAEVERAARQRL
ncbi:hypothetical protein G7048_03895 [Diaphorobacter sp. HDW4B]|uniref:hypothetical protein n=1 Tax=Diaphorobacter sp. HDW4B TaxID=2714925 RepID=UPI00140BC176|nr:hypothetical protein [Diaphorobacter sp. HDW4B]QIL68901.1 hypothetical protein G7048_03895 [Diaphorobacter sp. HDW4B]